MRGSTAGLPETFTGNGTTYYTLITILDLLFALFVVCPCVVGYWRSVWTLMDIYILPNDELMSAVVSTAIGYGGHLLFTFPQKVLERRFHPDRNRILFYIVSRSYTVCFAFVCVNGWRGPWHILTLHTKIEIWSVLATTAVGIVALVSIRGLRNVSAPPCVVVTDFVKGYFQVMTMFKISLSEKTLLYILDCLFSVLIVGTLVVFVWRGLWVMVDLFLFPDDVVWSAWSSLILGYALVAIAFMLQPVMRYVCGTLSGAPRLLMADFLILFSLIGTVNVWRGIWNLLDIYFLPDNQELSCWITHSVSLIVLILLGCSNSLLVRGVYIDAEEPAGKCVVFPCYYLRIIFQEEKLKKLNIKLQNQNCEKIAKLEGNLNEKNLSSTEKNAENNHIANITGISSLKDDYEAGAR